MIHSTFSHRQYGPPGLSLGQPDVLQEDGGDAHGHIVRGGHCHDGVAPPRVGERYGGAAGDEAVGRLYQPARQTQVEGTGRKGAVSKG